MNGCLTIIMSDPIRVNILWPDADGNVTRWKAHLVREEFKTDVIWQIPEYITGNCQI